MVHLICLFLYFFRIASSDQILEHLQSFSSRPIFYHTPECIRSGVPLFYIQQEGPSINMQLESRYFISKSNCEQAGLLLIMLLFMQRGESHFSFLSLACQYSRFNWLAGWFEKNNG